MVFQLKQNAVQVLQSKNIDSIYPIPNYYYTPNNYLGKENLWFYDPIQHTISVKDVIEIPRELKKLALLKGMLLEYPNSLHIIRGPQTKPKLLSATVHMD